MRINVYVSAWIEWVDGLVSKISQRKRPAQQGINAGWLGERKANNAQQTIRGPCVGWPGDPHKSMSTMQVRAAVSGEPEAC